MLLYETPLRIELIEYNLFVNGTQHPKATRLLRDMRKTLVGYEPEDANIEAYYMYRNVYRNGDLRYDVTVIPAIKFGNENAKTHGHYHPGSDDGMGYPELYQVLKGSALFILQKKNRNGSVDVMIVRADEGDTVLLPPGYGHVTINRDGVPLVLANVVCARFESLYDEYAEHRGAAYYYMNDGAIVQNSNYVVRKSENLPAKELNARHGFVCKDILAEVFADPAKFAFLAKPSLIFKQ